MNDIKRGSESSNIHIEAVLVMESHGTAPAVRTLVAFGGTWSKLFHAGSYYLDLTLRPEGSLALLQGQLLPAGDGEAAATPNGRVTLCDDTTLTEASTLLTTSGGFSLQVARPDRYRLCVEVEDETLTVSSLEVN